jgi:predicted transcriptional regulator
MPEDHVLCLLCEHSAVTLARHLKAVHGVTAESYRGQFPGTRIRSEACEANRREALTKACWGDSLMKGYWLLASSFFAFLL